MKNRIYWIAVALLTLFVLCLTASAQDDKDREDAKFKITLDDDELQLDLGDLKQLIQELTAGIEDQVGDLGELLDLEAMEEEVNEHIELTRKERKIVRSLLEEYKAHYSKGIVLKGNGEWLDEITVEAQGLLPSYKADLFTDWLYERDQLLKKRAKNAAALGEDIGKKAQIWAERYSHDIAREALKLGDLGEAYGSKWAKMAQLLARDIAEDSAKSAEKLAHKYQYQLQKSLSASSLKELYKLAELGEQDWDEFSERIRRITETTVNGIDWNDFAGDINQIVEQSLAAGIRSIEQSGDVAGEDLEAYAAEVTRAAEAYRKALDLKRDKRSVKSRAEWEELRKALRDAGLKEEFDAQRKALKEYYERRADHEEDEGKYESAKKTLIQNIKEQEEVIRSRDDELSSLREEIKALKKEVEQMRRDQRALERERRKLEEKR